MGECEVCGAPLDGSNLRVLNGHCFCVDCWMDRSDEVDVVAGWKA